MVTGVYSGAIYALVALGLTIIFQPTRIMNFAQGEAMVLGAAVSYVVVTLAGWGWAMGVLLGVVAAVLMGLLMERMIMLPVKLSGSRFAWIIATLAVALIFQSLFNLRFFDVDALRPRPMFAGSLQIFGFSVGWQQLVTVVVVLVVVAAYAAFLRRTAYGRAIRATSHKADTAVLMGIPVQRIIVLSFIIGTVITAIAGMLAAPVIFIAPAAGLVFTIKGFIAAVIGGVGSPGGALVGGMIVGLLDNVVRAWMGGSAGNFAVFAVLAVILVLFPAGLFGKPMESH
nr:branched-chain amino acid ABC transporter permease [Ornithinimicrobium sp. HY1745]